MLYNMKQVGRIVRPRPEPLETIVSTDAESKEVSSIASFVFATDPRTGLPSNDIGVYMSDKTHPDVKRFIEERLFMEIQPTNQIPNDMKDDAAIISAMPQKGETLNQYEARVQKMLDDEKLKHENERFDRELKERFNKRSKKSDDGSKPSDDE